MTDSPPTTSQPLDDIALLRWYDIAGVDECVGEAPVNRFAADTARAAARQAEASRAPTPLRPQPAPPSVPSHAQPQPAAPHGGSQGGGGRPLLPRAPARWTRYVQR